MFTIPAEWLDTLKMEQAELFFFSHCCICPCSLGGKKKKHLCAAHWWPNTLVFQKNELLY